MKNLSLVFGLMLVFIPPFCANPFALTQEQAIPILKEFIKTDLKILEIKEAPLEGFWEVLIDMGQKKSVLYIHKNLRFVLHGQLLDRQLKRNLTLDRLKELRRVEVESLPLENTIPMGQGKRKLYIFSDPECHFCFQLHEEIKLMKDIQAFLFLYPLTPSSYNKAKAIWCSPDKIKTLEEAYHGKELPSFPCDTRSIDQNIEIGKRLLIDSTPTLILPDGKIIEGYVPTDKLENLLKSS